MSKYANPHVLVSTDWVAENVSNRAVKLVEVDVDISAYEEGHIEGAVGWDWTTDLQDAVSRDILNKEQIEALLRRSGIRNDDTIVLYGDNSNWFAAHAYWQLKIYGHADVRIMDGGRAKWLAEERPVTTVVPEPEATNYLVTEVNEDLRASQSFVRENIGVRGIVDVRSPQEFSGEILAPAGMTETAQRAGHIPTAVNVPWGQVVNEDGTFKSAAELRELYANVGIEADQNVITYCRIGERSSHSWFVLKELLGFEDVRNYDGSWTEWGSMVGTPITNPSVNLGAARKSGGATAQQRASGCAPAPIAPASCAEAG